MNEYVKPRFDGKGVEFGLMHRDLGPGYLMLDIDRLSATLEVGLELRRENEGWVEYRCCANRIDFVALFEVKGKKTSYSEAALNPKDANSMVRAEMARRLGARLFVVFATDGRQPFEFYEIDTTFDVCQLVGTLTYDPNNRQCAVRNFWANTLRIDRWKTQT